MANNTVDTRVVRMEFDNKQFEKNVKQTSKSLDNLKQNLDFKGVGDSIDKVRVKISALQIVATTFVVNLTNRIIQLGTTLVKSLSVDNISAGWAKFGEKTTSVATMMAQKIRIAGKEITDLAEKTAIINEQLELLTWFSDETSYSFTDMVNNVGKFTAAGQDLDTSVKAMEGIATWAALSGQNAQTASRAMYQLAQAMGKGKIQRIDWMSIQNANMDTEEFRETILATAVAIGQLTKEGDQFVTKTGKKFTQSQFTEFLSEGWFTSDVLIKGLNKYSAAIDEIYAISEREGITASEVLEKYGDTLDQFGVKAFKAAQEARTFVDVLNSVKDAVSSKWMTTFENIFGGQEEAVKLWTELANELYDVFAESGNFRNDILKVWKEFGGRDDIFGEHGSANQGAFWNLYDAIIAVRDLIKNAWRTVFPLSEMEDVSDQAEDIGRQLKDLTKRIKEFTNKIRISEETGQRLSKVFQVIFSLLKAGLTTLKTIRFIIDPIIELAKQLVGKILDQILYAINSIFKTGNKLEALAIKLQSAIAGLIDAINVPSILDETFSFVKDIFELIKDTNPIENLIRFIEDFIVSFREAGGTSENFGKIIKGVLSILSLVRKTIISIASIILKTLTPILNDVIDVIVKIAGFILGTIVKVISTIMDLINNLSNSLKGSFNIRGFGETIFNLLDKIGDLAKATIPLIGSVVAILLKMVEVILLIPKILDNISKRLTGNGILDNLNKIFDGIVSAISGFIKGIQSNSPKAGSIEGLFSALRLVLEGLFEVLKGLLGVAQALMTLLGAALKKIGLALQFIANTFIKVFNGRVHELTEGEKTMLGVITALAIFAAILITLYNVFWLIMSVINPLTVVADSLSGALDSLGRLLTMSMISTLSSALLEISVALMLVAAMDTNALKRSITVLSSFLLILVAFTIAISLINKNMVTIDKDAKKLQKVNVKNNGLAMVAGFMAAIGNTMLKFAISLALLSKIKTDVLLKTLGTLSLFVVLMGGLAALMLVLSKDIVSIEGLVSGSSGGWAKKKGGIFSKEKNTLTAKNGILDGINQFISSFGNTMLKIAISLRIIGKLDEDSLKRGIETLVIVFGLVAGLMIVMKATEKKVGTKSQSITGTLVKTMVAFATAILSMAIAFRKIAQMSWENIGKALLVFTAFLVGITGMLAVLNATQKDVKKTKITKGSFSSFVGIAVAITSLSVALLVMVGAIALLGAIPTNKLWKGIGALATMLLAITLAIKALTMNNKGGSLKRAGAIVVIMSALMISLLGLSIFATALSLVPFGKIMLSIVSMTLMLAALTTAIIFINKSVNHKKLKSVLKTLLMMASIITATIVLAAVLKSLASIPWQQLLVATGAMILLLASLTGILVAMNKMTKSSDSANSILKVSAAFAILAVSLIPLAAALNMFATVPLVAIGKAMLTLVGSFVILGLTGAIVQPFIGVIVVLAASLLMVGMALLGAGVGILSLVSALEALKNNFAPALDEITQLVSGVVKGVITGLLDAMPAIIQSMTEVIEAIITSLIELFPKIVELIGTILEGVILILKEYGPQIIEVIKNTLVLIIEAILYILDTEGPHIIRTVVSLFTTLLETIAENMESIGTSVMSILTSLLAALRNSMGEIVDLIADIIVKILEGLTRNIGPLISALVDFLIALLGALTEYIGPLVESLVNFVMTVIVKVIEVITGKLIPLAGLLANVFLILIAAMLRIVIASLGALSKLLIVFVTSLLLMLAYTVTGLGKTLVQVFLVIVKECLKALIEAVFAFGSIFANLGGIILRLILSGLLNLLIGAFAWILDIIDFIFGTNIADKVRGAINGINDTLKKGALKAVDNISGSIQTVKDSMKQASTNINEVVTMTSDMANEAVHSGMSQIGDTVTDSMGYLSDALHSYGEQASGNLMDGLASGTGTAGQIGEDAANSMNEGFANEAEIHSPSRVFARFGNFLMHGLSQGIQNGSSETENAIAEVIGDSLQLATDILDGQEGDDYTIKVGMDISSVEAQTSKIQDIMSGVNDPSITASGQNAGYNARSLERNNRKGSETVNNDNSTKVTYNNTFNIESTDPQQSADEIDKVLKQQNTRFKLAHGT